MKHWFISTTLLFSQLAVAEVPFTIEGYGHETLGGWQRGNEVVYVDTLEDHNNPNSFRGKVRANVKGQIVGPIRLLLERAKESKTPTVIKFVVDGDIHLEKSLRLPSNITIEGRDRNVRLVGKGFNILGSSNIIITHISIVDVFPKSEDGIHIGHPDYEPSNNVVIDHVSLIQTGENGRAENCDEAISVVWGSSNITVQWSRIEGWEKAMLLGQSTTPQEIDGNIRMTLHHNYLHRNARRNPRAHHGIFHLYNNAIIDWRTFYRKGGQASENRTYGILCENGCRMRLEENVFEKNRSVDDERSWGRIATRCSPAWFNWWSSSRGYIDDLGQNMIRSKESAGA